jgi:hypothetical protein
MIPVSYMHPPARHSSRLGQRFQVALGAAAALAAIGLSPGSAQAYVVTVGGVQYDVTTFDTTPNSTPTAFATLNNGGVMPWWGDAQLAQDFATQVNSQLGYPNCSIAGGCGGGPFFAFRKPGNTDSYLWYQPTGALRGPQGNGPNQFRTFAQATLYTAPGPLPLFGAAAAFGFSRKLRKRIQASRVPAGSGQPRA